MQTKLFDERGNIAEEPEGFQAFWEEYPAHKRLSKGTARQSWRKIKPGPDLIRMIMNALQKQKKSPTFMKFTPMPATWLNGERWLDEIVDLPAGEIAKQTPVKVCEKHKVRLVDGVCPQCIREQPRTGPTFKELIARKKEEKPYYEGEDIPF